MNERLRQVLEVLGHPRICVLGDVMIDRYVHGDAERISPEAPIQVLRAAFDEDRLGGAGAVANNLVALEARVDLVSIVGDDAEGRQLIETLRGIGVTTSAVRQVKGRPTTVKTRYIGRAQHRIPQQVLRVDREDASPIDAATEQALLKQLERLLPKCEVLLVSDYAKGVITPRLCQAAIKMARRLKTPVLVDPIRSKDYSLYRGATLLTPNRTETEMASGLAISDESSVRRIARSMIEELKLDALVVTLDREGAYLGLKGHKGQMVPTRPRNVFDNAGAGDMVIAALSLAVAAGVPLVDAVALSNVAGGLEVEKFGVQTVSREEIAVDLMATSAKIRTLKQLQADLKRDRGNKLRIVFTNGCFDLLHHGHVQYLEFARSQGDRLVVGINSDASMQRLKGQSRPLVEQDDRARVLAGLMAVDYVVVFDEDTPADLIDALRPEILVKGEDWRDKGVVGQSTVESYGGRVVLAPLSKGASTSSIIAKIRAAEGFDPPLTDKSGGEIGGKASAEQPASAAADIHDTGKGAAKSAVARGRKSAGPEQRITRGAATRGGSERGTRRGDADKR